VYERLPFHFTVNLAHIETKYVQEDLVWKYADVKMAYVFVTEL
jgi:hypothetical protein